MNSLCVSTLLSSTTGSLAVDSELEYRSSFSVYYAKCMQQVTKANSFYFYKVTISSAMCFCLISYKLHLIRGLGNPADI
jgi:hypothetical protein